MPKWRNRQTQGTQNPPSPGTHEGSTPSFGIFFIIFLLFSQQILDKIVAVVNGNPITLSEVNSVKSLQEREITFEEGLEKTIILNLKYEEALKYISPSIQEEEIENLLKELKLEDKSKNRELISKLLVIKKYVELIIDPQIYVSEEEVQKYAEKNGFKIEENSAEFENIKKLLFLRKENENLLNWEEKLKKEAKIKILN